MRQGAGGIEQAEIAAGRAAERVAVEQVGHPADRLSQDDGRSGDDIGEFPGIDVVTFGVKITNDGSGDHAALDGHAALPDEGDFQQMVLVIGPIEEKHIPKPRADNAGQTAIQTHVWHMVVPAAILTGQEPSRGGGQHDAEAHDQAVHPDREIADMKQILVHGVLLLLDEREQLLDDLFHFRLVAQQFRRAFAQTVDRIAFQQEKSDLVDRRTDGRDLHKQVGTGLVLVHHPLDAGDMAADIF